MREAMSKVQAATKIDRKACREVRGLHHAGGLASAGGTECPVPIPAGRQGVSPANVLGVGPRRASVGAGLEPCNGNDRRQRRKQGVAVGAAASKTQAIAKRLLGAATRRCSRRKLPAGLLTTIAVTVSFQLTVLIQAHPHPKTGERCAF